MVHVKCIHHMLKRVKFALTTHSLMFIQTANAHRTVKLNCVQFATKFKVVNKKLAKLPDNIIPKFFPTYSANPKGPNLALFL